MIPRLLRGLPLLVALSACTAPYVTTEADLARGRFAAAPEAPRDSLVVASYNIRFAVHIDQAILDLRADPHLARADILLLQEMDPAGCERIARALGYDFAYYPASVHPRHDRPFGNAVLARGRIRRTGFTPLPLPGGITGTPRIAVNAEVEIDGRIVHAVSLHQSTRILAVADRLQQVRAVLEDVGARPGPVIVGGDFNTTGVQDTLLTGRLMRRAGFTTANHSGAPTIPLTLRTRFINNRTLDHLYARGLDLRRFGVVRGARASDHYPIWAVYEWPPAPGSRSAAAGS